MIIGLALVLYNQPKVELLVGIAGGMVGILPEFQELQNEIFIGQMLMAIGVIIMIPAIILKKKGSDNDDEFTEGKTTYKKD